MQKRKIIFPLAIVLIIIATFVWPCLVAKKYTFTKNKTEEGKLEKEKALAIAKYLFPQKGKIKVRFRKAGDFAIFPDKIRDKMLIVKIEADNSFSVKDEWGKPYSLGTLEKGKDGKFSVKNH